MYNVMYYVWVPAKASPPTLVFNVQRRLQTICQFHTFVACEYLWINVACLIFLTQSPFDAFLITRSLKTLAVRMERHCENAMKVAQYLESHPKVSKQACV